MKKTKALSDEALVDLVRSHDQELYEELVKRYQDKLLRYASYLTRDEDKAADIVQVALIKAFINLKGFNTKKKFSSWIYRIVHNEAINYLKKYRKEISLEKNGWLEEIASSENSLEEDFNRKEISQMLSLCLKEVPLSYRESLTLFYLEGKTYEEISDILRIPVGTVGTRISRGKKLIRAVWTKKGGEAYVKS
jgi:RNA polymerase sigma-70 factor (ECF subfamily)